MKKKVIALACTLALMFSLLPGPASASGLFFLGINDTLAPQSTQTTPIQSGGWIYVPVGALSSRASGVSLGIYYGFSEDGQSMTLYNLTGKSMTFDMANGTASAEGGESPVPSRVVRRNGTYYVPAYAICKYFGLSYYYTVTEYGPLLRIRNSQAVLNDSLYVGSVDSMLRSRYESYHQGQSGGGDPIPEQEEPAPKFSLYVGVRAEAGNDLTPILNGLANVRATALVFFPAESVADCADQIRQAAGRGHRVGLIPSGDTPEARLASVEKGSDLVEKILRQEVWFVLGSDTILSEAGYLCWSPGLHVATAGTAAQLYDSVVDHGEGRSSAARVLLDSRASGANLAAVLRQLAQDGDTFLSPRETRY